VIAMNKRSEIPVAILVDDDEDCRALYQRMLEARGYRVVTRGRAEGLVDLAVEQEAGAIIIDISLPGLSGIDACEQLKQDPRTTRIPIIMLTGHASFESVRLCTNAGVDGYLLKPAKPSRVLALLARLVWGEADLGDRVPCG